jgi:hypothetical protein
MALKSVIPKDIIAGNKFTLSVDNEDLLVVSVSSPEESLQTVELPDGTMASGGRTDPSEITIIIPQHVEASKIFLDTWWQGCKDPVAPNAYKSITVTGESSSGQITSTSTGVGVFIKDRTGATYSLEDGTEMTTIEYTCSVDEFFHS